MKKVVVILIVLACFLAAAIAGVVVASNSSTPFQKGIMEEGYYYNPQAKLMFMLPAGWEGSTGRNYEFDMLFPTVSRDSQFLVDFVGTNSNTSSTVALTYFETPLFMTVDSFADQIVDQVIKESSNQEDKFEFSETLQKTIGGKDCRVDVLKTKIENLEVHIYCCFFSIDEYCGMLIIIPNELVTSPDSFEGICKSFVSLE